jgi:hypothetical protein
VKKLGAGSEIDAWCTRCRMDLGHRIIAMVGPQPKRVICQTCNSQHNYRPPRTLPITPSTAATPHRQPKAPAKPTARARSEHERLALWESKIAGQSVSAFTRYAMDRAYREGQLILHSKFGEGYVVDVLENGKVSIMFRDGPRTLAHRPG